MAGAGSVAEVPDDLLTHAWDSSYERQENFVFYPNEELIRFVSRHVCVRTGLDNFNYISPFTQESRWLDLGCGIGRHVVYAHDLGFEAYGIDLSTRAVELARTWALRVGMTEPDSRIVVGSVGDLPWEDNFFDVVVSHAVLDSMPFALARQAVCQVGRVLSPAGLMYCDLIAATQHGWTMPRGPSVRLPGFTAAGSTDLQQCGYTAGPDQPPGEIIVDTPHEQGTIQSYFDEDRIAALFEGVLKVVSLVRVTRTGITGSDRGMAMYASHTPQPRAIPTYSNAVVPPGITGSDRLPVRRTQTGGIAMYANSGTRPRVEPSYSNAVTPPDTAEQTVTARYHVILRQ